MIDMHKLEDVLIFTKSGLEEGIPYDEAIIHGDWVECRCEYYTEWHPTETILEIREHKTDHILDDIKESESTVTEVIPIPTLFIDANLIGE